MLDGDNLLILRLATIKDAQNLLDLRNDDSVRTLSHNTNKIMLDEHILWLKKTLIDKDKKIFIAEKLGVFVGMIRADFCNGFYKLSWAVLPKMQGNGFGKKILALLMSNIDRPIKAKIKAENIASIRLAEGIGMRKIKELNGILYYQKDY